MVNGCKRCCTGKLYAMKVLNKKRIKMKNAEELCINERNILARVESRFVVTLKYAFQTQHDLFLILDLMTGGDLAFHLNRARGNLPVDRAKFYAAQVLLGVSHLHEAGFVYRDLKPENVLLDNEGNCRISDLGLACNLSPKLSGRCGTRGYWAPEMLAKDPNGHRLFYDQAVDWWSFGCLVYEMLYGKCPFRTTKAKNLNPSDKQKSMDQATLEMDPDYIPEKFTADAMVLCKGLLTRDPKRRLGSGDGKAREIMKQAWFSTISWAHMELGKIKPPFLPDRDINAASQNDIGSFDEPGKTVTLSKEDTDVYRDWDFVSPKYFQYEMVEFMEWEEKQGPIKPVISNDSCCCLI